MRQKRGNYRRYAKFSKVPSFLRTGSCCKKTNYLVGQTSYLMEGKNPLPPVGLDVAENSLVNDFGVYGTYGITDTSQFFEERKCMDLDLTVFTLWNLQLFVSGFLLLKHSTMIVLGLSFKISSQFYFHCWNIILYIALTALKYYWPCLHLPCKMPFTLARPASVEPFYISCTKFVFATDANFSGLLLYLGWMFVCTYFRQWYLF